MLPFKYISIISSIFLTVTTAVGQSRSNLPPNNLTLNPQGDISYLKLINRNPDCGAYTGEYNAMVYDHQQGNFIQNKLIITTDEETCTFISNNIPNHDIGEDTTTGGNFASTVSENQLKYVVQVPRFPKKKRRVSYIRKIAGKLTLNGIMLNGVDLDMDSAFCYNPSFTTPSQISLGTRSQCGLRADWYAIPAANPNNVVLDKYTGHAFSGRYHYHGDNNALSEVYRGDILQTADSSSSSGSPVIGFAPDGFPIYGHYFFDIKTGELRKATSSWKIYQTERKTAPRASIPAPSIETHPRGMFVEDWYYVSGSGDLDECNGMTDAYGNYGYYYTEEYPYGPLCSFGSPHTSFIKSSNEYKNNN